MGDLKARLLPPRPKSELRTSDLPIKRPLFNGIDPLSLKKRAQGVRSWIRIDTAGNSHVLEVDKAAIMRRCDLPARDLRLLDPLFVYPSTILGRESAIVVNLEQIRCIITADEVLLLNSLDNYVLQYVTELQRRLRTKNQVECAGFNWPSPGGQPISDSYPGNHQHPNSFNKNNLEVSHPPMNQEVRHKVVNDGDMFSGSSSEYLPFEFRALEVALEAACTFLDTQAAQLEEEIYPVLDELTSKISTLNLEHVRRLKSHLVALTRRVQKVRDEIEQLMDDDGDMVELYLTEKKEQVALTSLDKMAYFNYNNMGAGASMSAPVSPVCSPTSTGQFQEKSLDKMHSFARSRQSHASSQNDEDRVEELEMLLEAYFVVVDGTLNKLTSLKEYIDDTEDFINIQLDNVRNQLIQFELLLTTATFVVAIFGVVAGVFGMNIPIDLFDEPRAFKWILGSTGVAGFIILFSFIWFFKQKHLMFT
ncbi:unnamed protein product [Sphagnum jensenii]|uniref:Magnesium transporter n=1 Tax=Sphagnum jensenii TaxID=128206 RepID=A0ABP1BRT1_9BRYO